MSEKERKAQGSLQPTRSLHIVQGPCVCPVAFVRGNNGIEQHGLEQRRVVADISTTQALSERSKGEV